MTQYHGGNKMGKNKKFAGPPADEVLKPIVEEHAEAILAPKEVTEEVVEKEAVIDGVDMSLNIRMAPEVKSNNQIGILRKGTKLIVMNPDKDIKGSGESWFQVKFGNPEQVGYAMKKYIRIL